MTCRDEIRELVVWAGGADLDAAERSRVAAHVEACEECRDLLRFAERVGAAARRAEAVAHPSAETLVRWVENPGALAAGERAGVAAHVDACTDCAREVRLLREVDADPAAAHDVTTAPARVETPGRERPDDGWLRRALRVLGAGPLAPAPAAAYLVAAVFATALLLRGPSDAPPTGAFVSGPLRLDDTRAVVRGSGDTPPVEIAAAEPATLLLEMTELAKPPADGDTFRIVLARTDDGADAAGPVWERGVVGAEFSGTYSLVLYLPGGTLPRGTYDVRVLGAGGAVAFESTLLVR